jgi:hypothetical protein
VTPEDKKSKRGSSSSSSESRSSSRSRSRSKDKKSFIPTTEAQLKYVVLQMLKPDSFLYPTPTTDFFEDLRNSYKEIKGAYNYLGRLNCEKVLEEIRNSNGIVIEEHSKGTSKSKFIMRVNKDKIQQLCRENHRDRPQKEIDLDCIINDVANEDREKRIKEDKKRLKDELIRQRRFT